MLSVRPKEKTKSKQSAGKAELIYCVCVTCHGWRGNRNMHLFIFGNIAFNWSFSSPNYSLERQFLIESNTRTFNSVLFYLVLTTFTRAGNNRLQRGVKLSIHEVHTRARKTFRWNISKSLKVCAVNEKNNTRNGRIMAHEKKWILTTVLRLFTHCFFSRWTQSSRARTFFFRYFYCRNQIERSGTIATH